MFSTDGLKRMFGLFEKDVDCVVLNACYSQQQAQAICSTKTYVVGMNKAIPDEAAIKFAKGFYQGLGEGNDYDFAYENGRVMMSSQGNVTTQSSTQSPEARIPELWYRGKKIKPEGGVRESL